MRQISFSLAIFSSSLAVLTPSYAMQQGWDEEKFGPGTPFATQHAWEEWQEWEERGRTLQPRGLSFGFLILCEEASAALAAQGVDFRPYQREAFRDAWGHALNAQHHHNRDFKEAFWEYLTIPENNGKLLHRQASLIKETYEKLCK